MTLYLFPVLTISVVLGLSRPGRAVHELLSFITVSSDLDPHEGPEPFKDLLLPV